MNSNKEPANKKTTYLALGDSYTIGEGVAEHERYPNQLCDSLASVGVVIDSTTVIARTGWTTDELLTNIESAKLTPPYNLVTLLIGVNNQYRGQSIEKYKQEFTVLLKLAINLAGDNKERVIVISIPDWGVTPFAEGRNREKISLEIDEFNAVNYQISNEMGVAYINVTSISREAQTNKELLAADGLHPSGKMYKRWVDELYNTAFTLLKNQN
jgi:lysophospholipase L1-like esterase